jgi:ribosome biogenesis GTPase
VTGIVTAILANYYQVQVPGESTTRLCKKRSLLVKTGIQAWVGDLVEITEEGSLYGVLPRHSLLLRPAIANIDRVVLVLGATTFDPYVASRFLVEIEAAQLNPLIVLSKIDLLPDPDVLSAQLEAWGYPVLNISSQTGQGLPELVQALQGQTAVLAGPSGAGKSSLLNALEPGLSLRVQAVSATRQGRHTTRHVELFTLAQGFRLADTPGFSHQVLSDTPALLSTRFPEFAKIEETCQFRNCLHQEEPGCGIRAGQLERYPIYRTFLTEILAQTNTAASKTTNKSKLPAEHRRISRRRTRQDLPNEED